MCKIVLRILKRIFIVFEGDSLGIMATRCSVAYVSLLSLVDLEMSRPSSVSRLWQNTDSRPSCEDAFQMPSVAADIVLHSYEEEIGTVTSEIASSASPAPLPHTQFPIGDVGFLYSDEEFLVAYKHKNSSAPSVELIRDPAQVVLPHVIPSSRAGQRTASLSNAYAHSIVVRS